MLDVFFLHSGYWNYKIDHEEEQQNVTVNLNMASTCRVKSVTFFYKYSMKPFRLEYMDCTRGGVGYVYISCGHKISIKLVAISYLHGALSNFCAT